MDELALSLLSGFDYVEEVVQTLLVSNVEGDYRIELLRSHKGGRAGYRPRIYRQERMVVPVVSGEVHDPYDPKPREMLMWRDYEMGFGATEDLNMALKMAVLVIEQKRGR